MPEGELHLRPEPPDVEAPVTTRLRMEPLGPAQEAEVAALHRDAATMEWLAGVLDAEQTRSFLEAEAAHWKRHGFGLWALRLRGDGRFVGRGGLRHTVVAGRPEVELAYALHAEHWGLGLASELAEAALAVGFERLGLPRITCFTQPHNQASLRVMKKAGFVVEGDIVHADLPHVLHALHTAERGEPGYCVRLARSDEIEALPAIERAATVLFAGTGYVIGVAEGVSSLEDLAGAQEDGLLWVAVGPGSRPVGFALVERCGDGLHLDELAVHPSHGRRGLGAALVRAACEEARQRGETAVTLTTFRNLPFNAPFYRGLGFRELTPAEQGLELARLVRQEDAAGLPAKERVVMCFEPQSQGDRS